MPVDVRRAAIADLDPAAEVLGEAFAAYAWTAWTIDPDDHQHRVAQLQRLALESEGLPFGQVWVAVLDDRIRSVAVWMDSDVPVPDAVTERVRPATVALEGTRHRAAMAAARELPQWRPRERYCYLATIGTSPAVQRRGLARLVMVPGLAAADEERVPSFLETSAATNLTFYASLGFEVIDHRTISGGGPDVWAMLRPPP